MRNTLPSYTTTNTDANSRLPTPLPDYDECTKNKISPINLVSAMVLCAFIILSTLTFIVIPVLDARYIESTSRYDPTKDRSFRYDWPPPSGSNLGKYRKTALTSDHGLCSEIGRDIMFAGGNAVDSTIAALLCLGITNPQSSGLGGGFLMTMYNRTTKRCTAIDARESAPGAATRDMFGNDTKASKYGWRAVATPGELAGYRLAFERFGSGNVSWQDLFQPSIDLARKGFPVSEYLAKVLVVKEPQFHVTPSMREWINPKTGKTFEHGDIIKRTVLADTYEKLAKSEDPVELFYRGQMGKIIADEFQKNGGILTKQDLSSYEPRVYNTPLITDPFSKNLVMCGPPPPSSFSVMQFMVRSLDQYFCGGTERREIAQVFDDATVYNPAPSTKRAYNDAKFYHYFIEASKFAYSQRAKLGDMPEAFAFASNMTSAKYLHWILSMIPEVAKDQDYYRLGQKKTSLPEDHGTSHVSSLDSQGNGVSATSTVNRWFGATVQSEAYGIVWNDEMDDFSTPGFSNGFGFAPSEANFIAPNKRPMSSMTPTVIYNKSSGDIKMVIGASGGSKIITAVAKATIRVLCFNETIKEAIDAPSVHNQFTPFATQFEPDVPEELLADLTKEFNQTFVPSTGFEGVTQGIVVGTDGFIYANGDARRATDQHTGGF